MQIKNLQCGGQTLVHGNIVNVPMNITPTVKTLPRHMKDIDTIVINFKQKTQNRHYEYQENVCPMAVWKAAKYLLANSELYDQANIQIDTDWLNGQYDENFEDNRNTIDHTFSSGGTFTGEDNDLDTDQDNDSYDELDEDDIQRGIVDMDTMLHEQDIPLRHVTLQDVGETVPEELTFTPGQGQKSISVFEDTDSEYLAFPNCILCTMES